MTPSQPAAAACSARLSTSSSTLRSMPIAARSEGAMLVSTVTTRILSCSPFRKRGRFHDRAVAVHGQERRARAAQLPHGRRHRRGNVIELEIGEDLLVALDEPVEQLEVVARGRELEPDLVERDAIVKACDELLRAFEVRNVEREDQSVAIGDAARGFCDCGGHGRILAAASGRRAGHRASATRSGRSCRRCSRRRRGQRRPRRPPRPYPKRASRAPPASARSGPSAR